MCGIKEIDNYGNKILDRVCPVCYNRSRSDGNLQLDIMLKRHGWWVPLLVCYDGRQILDKVPPDVI